MYHGRKKFFWRPKNTLFSFHIALIECISLRFRVLLGPCQFTQVGLVKIVEQGKQKKQRGVGEGSDG